MLSTSDQQIANNTHHDCKVNFLDLILVMSRHICIILSVTLATCLVAIYVMKSTPKTYISSAKLIALEFVDQTKEVHVGNNGSLIFGKRQGYWKPADASFLKSIIDSSRLKLDVHKQLILPKDTEYTLRTFKDDQSGIVTVTVTSKDQELTSKIVTGSIESAGRQAFRLGFLSSPVPVDEIVSNQSDGIAMVIHLFEMPKQGQEIKPNILKRVILPTLMGLCCSVFLALALDYFQNLSNGDRRRIAMITCAIRGKKQSISLVDNEEN